MQNIASVLEKLLQFWTNFLSKHNNGITTSQFYGILRDQNEYEFFLKRPKSTLFYDYSTFEDC